jgi:3'(2'), 5'-bisphosphate nucleotidase
MATVDYRNIVLFLLIFQVGLALVVNGELALGVMGCPNWSNNTTDSEEDVIVTPSSSRGVLVVSHAGCGTWSRRLSAEIDQFTIAQEIWTRCYVDTCSVVHKARYCLSDGQTWDMILLSRRFNSL